MPKENIFDKMIEKYKIEEPTIISSSEKDGRQYTNYGYKNKENMYYKKSIFSDMDEEEKKEKIIEQHRDAVRTLCWGSKNNHKSDEPVEHDFLIGVTISKEDLKEMRKELKKATKDKLL